MGSGIHQTTKTLCLSKPHDSWSIDWNGTPASMLSTTVQSPGEDAPDLYQWLEEVLGKKPLAWVKERNFESVGELAQSTEFRLLEHRILDILDSDARIPAIQKIGPYYYNFWRDARNRRGLWRRTTWTNTARPGPTGKS